VTTHDQRNGRRYALTYAASLVLALAVWAPVPLPGLPLTVTQAAATLLLLAFAAESVARYRSVDVGSLIRVGPSATVLVLGIVWIGLSGLASTVVAVDRVAAATFAVRYAVGLGVIVAVSAAVRRGDRWRTLLATVTAGGALVVALAWAGTRLPSLGALTLGVSSRSEALFEHPNQFGMMLSTVLPIAAAFVLASRGARAVLAAGVTLLLLHGTFLSGSIVNAAVAAATLLSLAVLIQLGGRRTAAKAAGLTAVVAVGAIGVALAPRLLEPYFPRIARGVEAFLLSPFSLSEAVPSFASRLAIYQRAGEVISDHPFVGIGGDNAYLVLTTGWASNVSHAHNLFLNAALSLGAIGLMGTIVFGAGWCVLAFLVMRRAWTVRPNATPLYLGLGIGMLAFFVTNQSSDSLGGTIIYVLWLWLGAGLAMTAAALDAPGPVHATVAEDPA